MTKSNYTPTVQNFQTESLFARIGSPLSKLSVLSEFLDMKESQTMTSAPMSTESMAGMRRTIDSVIGEIFTMADLADCEKNKIIRELDQLKKTSE